MSSFMESQFKMRISRMFRSSFGSCRSKNISDVIENPVVMAHQTRRDYCYSIIDDDSLLSKVPSFASVCRPKCSESARKVVEKDHHQRRRVSDRGVFYIVTGDTDGRICPPASPISTPLMTMNSFFEVSSLDDTKNKRPSKKKKKKKKPKKKNSKESSYRLISSSGDSNHSGWFSSEDDDDERDRNRDRDRDRDETEKFFSSKSFSTSDSSECHRRKKKSSSRRRRRRASSHRNFEMCLDTRVTKGKVEESFAVVKRSSDPKSDFRNSMVEMIIEKQLFASKDLEQLLQCFLYLNPSYHHRVIVEVFWEIWDALFLL